MSSELHLKACGVSLTASKTGFSNTIQDRTLTELYLKLLISCSELLVRRSNVEHGAMKQNFLYLGAEERAGKTCLLKPLCVNIPSFIVHSLDFHIV